MQFLLAKIITLLLSPANWLVITGLAFLLVRKKNWKRTLGISWMVLVLLFTNPLLYRWAYRAWEIAPVPLTGTYEAAILPGGLASYDIHNRGFFNRASDRFIQAAGLCHEGRTKHILVTGGNGFLNRENPPEAWFLRQELLRNGIDSSAILVDDRSRNTRENAVYSKKLADSMGWKGPLLLVTSAMHMRRCLQDFQRVGLSVIPYPCNYEVIRNREPWYGYIWPDLDLPGNWGRLMKEWAAYLAGRWSR